MNTQNKMNPDRQNGNAMWCQRKSSETLLEMVATCFQTCIDQSRGIRTEKQQTTPTPWQKSRSCHKLKTLKTKLTLSWPKMLLGEYLLAEHCRHSILVHCFSICLDSPFICNRNEQVKYKLKRERSNILGHKCSLLEMIFLNF